MDVTGAEGKAVVDEGGVDHEVLFGSVQQVVEVAEMSEAAAYAVARAVLVQHKHLARTEPSLRKHTH